jgi:hypothetical protein
VHPTTEHTHWHIPWIHLLTLCKFMHPRDQNQYLAHNQLASRFFMSRDPLPCYHCFGTMKVPFLWKPPTHLAHLTHQKPTSTHRPKSEQLALRQNCRTPWLISKQSILPEVVTCKNNCGCQAEKWSNKGATKPIRSK